MERILGSVLGHAVGNAMGYQAKDEEREVLLKKISNGVKIKNTFNIENKVIFKYKNKLLGIYEKQGDYLITWKNFI